MKGRLLYITVDALARLPLCILYIISDIACFILRDIIRYRRRVVRDNLEKCFPDATEKTLRQYRRRFYRNFTDNFIETIKLLHISDKEILDRMEFADVDIIDNLFDQGKSIAVYFSHTFCWEWAPSISLHTRHKPSQDCIFAQVYRPLRDTAADSLMLRIRSRFGSESLPKATVLRHLLQYRRDKALSITGFMSDQRPSHGDPGHKTTLLGRPTLIISGTETLARKLGLAVIYWDLEKTSRGHYRITTRLISENPTDEPEGAITEKYTRLLENTIRRNPPLWLWSHKRWKAVKSMDK